ncbi:hypothetical protein UlMin_008422 [Ulmus minor]
MAAKLLHSLADENPDLQKQIGCMTGIFHIFDRHHIITGRRLNQKRLPPPPGSSHDSNSNSSLERPSNNAYHQQTAAEKNVNKSVNERQRLSTESSRASFSSTCSSLSSLECNKTAQQEASPMDRIIFPETSSRDPMMNQSSISPEVGRQSLDLRDVVKDSMYREARGLSVKTAAKEEAASHKVKHRDSPRPLQLSKQVDGSNGVGTSGKKTTPADLKESLRVLSKLREAPWYYNETRESSRSSYESKDGNWHSTSRDAPRFSCDGREINRQSFESRDVFRSTGKLKEFPRLSLDSREVSLRGSHSDLKPAHHSKFSHSGGDLNERDHKLPESSGTQKRPPSVVAKLMGLDALPDSGLASDNQLASVQASPAKDSDLFHKSLQTNNVSRSIRTSISPRSSVKEPTSPCWKNPDLVMKPISSSRVPIEPAPWRMQDGSRGFQRPTSRLVKVPARTANSFPSVYSEIEKRLKDIEFKQSGKDLRALKQILDSMQAKGLLEASKEEQASNFGTQRDYEPKYMSSSLNMRSVNQKNPQSNQNASAVRGSDSSRNFESPIVIMKPAKLIQKSGISASSVIPVDDHYDLHKRRSGGNVESKKGQTNSRTAKDKSPKYSRSDSALNSVDKRASSRNARSANSMSRSQQLPVESSTTSSAKSSGSVSPRLQQKKLEMERRSRPPTPPSNSNKSRRQTNRHQTDSGSPGGKARLRPSTSQQSDDQLSEISNDSRAWSCQGDDASVNSDSNMLLDSKIDIEVTSAPQSSELNASIEKRTTPRLDEEESFSELATDAPEHPSPVSVLDTSAYRDDAPSPVKQIPNTLKGDGAQESKNSPGEDQWSPADNITGSGPSPEINRKKLENIENLVQKLRRLNSNHDEARTDYIASLCENTNPDHRYISEILLASGLLLCDLSSGLTTFQLHPSGHPINPELFLVLEQTKASSLQTKEECNPGRIVLVKLDKERLHRKLIFDAVNEILVGKLASVSASPEPWLKPVKLAKKTLNAQMLLKELCFEIEQFRTKNLEQSLEEEDDGLKGILCDDVMHRTGKWTDFSGEISGLVLDVERSIFKDLVAEVVIGEAANLRAKPGRRRQLFTK